MDKPGLGTLATLPREVRDEIYRCLVKSRYIFRQDSHHEGAMVLDTWEKPTLAIFSVSKAMYDEATMVFYLESVFLYHIDLFEESDIYSTGPALSRMTNVELRFYSYYNPGRFGEFELVNEYNLGAMLDTFTGLGVLRNSISISLELDSPESPLSVAGPLLARLKSLVGFELDPPEGPLSLAGPLFRRLKALVGFRTLNLRITPYDYRNTDRWSTEKFEIMARATEKELTPIMGPAIVTRADLNICFAFRPLDHLRAKLSTQPKGLLLDMGKMNELTSGLEGVVID